LLDIFPLSSQAVFLTDYSKLCELYGVKFGFAMYDFTYLSSTQKPVRWRIDEIQAIFAPQNYFKPEVSIFCNAFLKACLPELHVISCFGVLHD